MRVLCINDDFSLDKNRENFKYILELPKQLEEYTVIFVNEYDGYILKEINAGVYPNGLPISFKSERFIRIDELHVEENLYSYKVEMKFDTWTE